LSYPSDIRKRSRGLQALIRGDISTYQNTARLKHWDGHWVWVENRSKVLERDENGAPMHCVGVLIDITERKDLETALLRNQKLEALGTLAGGIAHDFNNLLTPMLGYAELAKRSLPGESKERGYIDHIRKAAERAKQLVLNILLISRQGASDKQPVSLVNLIEEVLVIIKASSSKGLIIDKQWSENLPSINADPDKIYQVVLNLCTNAVQAMPPQGHLIIGIDYVEHAPSIPEHQQAAEGYLMMTVEDNGSGIPPEVLTQIFDPFFTTKLKGEQRGTGLGLSIVDSVIKDHDGSVDVVSEPGVGTRFTIHLPATSRPDTTEGPAVDGKVVLADARVMLIEDEAMVRELGESMLEQLGLSVTSFADGWTALAEFSKHPDQFDIVLTDYEMPELTGLELLGHLRKIRDDIPVVLLTGYANLATEEKRVEHGFDGVLAKPYTPETLEEVMILALNNTTPA
ncbi:MAG: ATP-binding protein, partial [Halieaceae bacterium]|nr:ATP-binding protein [Halieaceae bacterium]